MRNAVTVRALSLAATGVVAVPMLLLGLLLWRSEFGKEASAERFAYVKSSGGLLPKLWQTPPFSYRAQHGQEVSSVSLRGEPWIVDFIFTECTSACPMMTSKMVLLQRELAGARLRFVSFSVDPKHDSPTALAAYASKWNGAESRWTLLSTDADHVKETALGFRVTAQATDDVANPIVHSSVFFLVDAEGWVRGVYDSNDSAALSRLVTDARGLAVKVPPRAVERSDGSLYSSLGCAGCHTNARIAPPLENLNGREVRLEDGTSVVANAGYVRRSILEPGAQIVAGYAPLMPSYAKQLSDEQIAALVAEVEAMRSAGTPAAPTTPVTVVIDPVCHMKVRASPDALHVSHAGEETYFCSEECRDAFVRDPSRFVDAGDTTARR